MYRDRVNKLEPDRFQAVTSFCPVLCRTGRLAILVFFLLSYLQNVVNVVYCRHGYLCTARVYNISTCLNGRGVVEHEIEGIFVVVGASNVLVTI